MYMDVCVCVFVYYMFVCVCDFVCKIFHETIYSNHRNIFVYHMCSKYRVLKISTFCEFVTITALPFDHIKYCSFVFLFQTKIKARF